MSGQPEDTERFGVDLGDLEEVRQRSRRFQLRRNLQEVEGRLDEKRVLVARYRRDRQLDLWCRRLGWLLLALSLPALATSLLLAPSQLLWLFFGMILFPLLLLYLAAVGDDDRAEADKAYRIGPDLTARSRLRQQLQDDLAASPYPPSSG